MSVVYRANDSLHEREVALKVLKLSEDEPRNLLYLQQEFRSMTRLRHPRLVQVFDYGVLDSGTSYFTMELLGGEDLSSVGKLALASIFQVLLSIADVLTFMHARGYVHRDVKPANVRILPTASSHAIEVKLMDCGLTEQLGQKGNAVAGTLAYLAPEAWLGSPTDVRGDLYALGVLAYEITTGQLPFDASTGVRLLKTKTERPRDLREVRPDVPAEFARLVRDLLAPEPANRPASALEVVSRLSEFADIDFDLDPTVYLRTPALVGRNRELGDLRCAVTEAFSGKPNPTVIVGPAGTGKTRLLDELLLEIGMRGAIVARASARGFAGSPYEVLEDLLAPLLHVPAAESVLDRIGDKATLLPSESHAASEGNQHAVDPVAARRARHAAFATFVDGISKHRQVLFAIDDIHLADAASLDALNALITGGIYGNLAIVATLRTGEPISHSLEQVLSSSRRLELDRMTREQIGDLIVGALGPVAASPTLVEDVERSCSGNVYFALEILRDLANRGLIQRKRTRLVIPDSLVGTELPQSLAAALGRRVATLSPTALRLAQLGAVLDNAMDFTFARSLSALNDEGLLDAVDELRLHEVIDLQDRRIRIHHRRLRDVLYQGIGLVERRVMHRAVAQGLLAESNSSKRDRSAELGYHFAEAGDASQALTYLVGAGDARYQEFAYFDAKEAYQRALALTGAAVWHRRRELERKLNDRLGRICFYHDHEHGPEYLEVARRLHLRHGALLLIAPLSHLVGATVAVIVGLLATALYNAARLRPQPLRRALERLLDYFSATTYLANCHVYSGHCPAALAAADQLLPFVYSSKKLPRGGYLMARAAALHTMHRFDEAASGCEETLSILRREVSAPISEHDRVHLIGGALVTRLWVDLTRGYTKTSDWWKPAEGFARAHPTAMLQSWMMEVRVFAAARQGTLAETEHAWNRFRQTAAQAEVKFVHARTKVWLGRAYVEAGRLSDAEDMADEVIGIARELDNPSILAYGMHLRAMALHAWEQLDAAEACLNEAAAVAARSDVACWEVYHAVLLSQAGVALDRFDYARAKQLASKVLDHNAELLRPHDLHCCFAHRTLGRIASGERRFAAAYADLDQALRLATKFDDALERAKCLHYLTLNHVARGENESAERCQTECVRLLTETDNGYLLNRFGYATVGADSGTGVSVLSRVVQLVSGTDLGSHPGSEGAKSRPKDPAEVGTIAVSVARPRDATLVAGDSSASFSSTPG